MKCLFITLMNQRGEFARVDGRNEFGEYRVELVHTLARGRARINPQETYFTSDLDDACETAQRCVFFSNGRYEDTQPLFGIGPDTGPHGVGHTLARINRAQGNVAYRAEARQ